MCKKKIYKQINKTTTTHIIFNMSSLSSKYSQALQSFVLKKPPNRFFAIIVFIFILFL